MLKRQIIQVVIALAVVAVSFMISGFLASNAKAPEKKALEKTIRLVKAKTIANDTLKRLIPINGKLAAKEKVEIFPEVTGVLLNTGKSFKVGQSFKKGEAMLALDGSESLLNLKAQRSSFINLLSQAMPDLKIDYSDEYERWKAYLDALSPSKPLEELPEVSNPMLKNFLSGRNIYQQYFSIKSMENRQGKFTISAPFDGSVSMGNVNPGTVIRANQKVGEFIQDHVYEFEAAVAANDAKDIHVGDQVSLKTDRGNTFSGVISRVASKVDPNTQRIALFAEVKGDQLKEGVYLEGTVSISDINNAVELDRNLIQEGDFVYVIEDSVLAKKPVQVSHEFEQNALVTGLSNGDVILNQVIEGAYVGMLVKIEGE